MKKKPQSPDLNGFMPPRVKALNLAPDLFIDFWDEFSKVDLLAPLIYDQKATSAVI